MWEGVSPFSSSSFTGFLSYPQFSEPNVELQAQKKHGLQTPCQPHKARCAKEASLVAHLVKNPSAIEETPVRFLGREDALEKGQATDSSIHGLPWWLRQERICLQRGRPGFDPWVGRSPGGGHGNPLQYSCLGESHGQRSLVGYSSWDRKELDTTE